MRDVTDNVTGELPGVEKKRGRGRPRKAHAMTNAERQAAFRARRKAQQPVEAKSVTKRMTVTEMLSDVDAYDECRLEVDALRAELVEARERLREMEGYVNGRDRENDHLLEVSAELALTRYELSVQLDKNVEAEREIERLCKELAAAKKRAIKSVTPSNGNSNAVAESVTHKRVTKKAEPKKVETVVVSRDEWPFPAQPY